MPLVTRFVGFALILLGLASYFVTGRTSLTALIPAFVGALFLLLALVARNPAARRHVMHAAVALALLGALGTLPRIAAADDFSRPAVIAQILMAAILVIYVALGVKSFIDARRARQGKG